MRAARIRPATPSSPFDAETLGAFLSRHRFPLHSRLPPERRLCELLSVSRATLRRELGELERQGLIWRHVGKGTFVGGRPQSVHSCAEALGVGMTLTELLEMRMLIEPQTAGLAAVRGERREIDLIDLYERLASEARDWASWDRWDELFHRAIAEATGNGLIISTVDQILRVKRRTPWSIAQVKDFDPALHRRYVIEHRSVVDAIAKRDRPAAEQAMKEHIRGIASSIGPAVGRGADTGMPCRSSRQDATRVGQSRPPHRCQPRPASP